MEMQSAANEQGVILGAMELQVDATAAFRIIGGQGLGKVRHLDVSCLLIQAAVLGKQVALKKINTNRQQHGRHQNSSVRQRFDDETNGKSGMCPLRSVESGDWSIRVRTDTAICTCNRPWPPSDRTVDVPGVMQHTKHDLICSDM